MQWTKNAKEYMQKEIHTLTKEIKEDIENNINITLQEVNERRQKIGLKPKKRIDKEIIKQTIINISTDASLQGDDIQRKEIDFETRGMYL